jgi:hypothetical protein
MRASRQFCVRTPVRTRRQLFPAVRVAAQPQHALYERLALFPLYHTPIVLKAVVNHALRVVHVLGFAEGRSRPKHAQRVLRHNHRRGGWEGRGGGANAVRKSRARRTMQSHARAGSACARAPSLPTLPPSLKQRSSPGNTEQTHGGIGDTPQPNAAHSHLAGPPPPPPPPPSSVGAAAPRRPPQTGRTARGLAAAPAVRWACCAERAPGAWAGPARWAPGAAAPTSVPGCSHCDWGRWVES